MYELKAYSCAAILPFAIQIQLGETIYEQIVRAVKKAVATGQIQPGAQMPALSRGGRCR
jgi:hypothetical protein